MAEKLDLDALERAARETINRDSLEHTVCPWDVVLMVKRIRALESASQPGGGEGADKVDAERYRWLRNCARSVDWTRLHPSSSWSTVTSSHCRIDRAAMDAAIDEAIAAPSAGSGEAKGGRE